MRRMLWNRIRAHIAKRSARRRDCRVGVVPPLRLCCAPMPTLSPSDPLPIDAVQVPAGHRDVRREVTAVIPARPAPLAKRLLWRVLLVGLRIPGMARWLRRLRSR
jgi:hypothetical protein